MITFEDAVREVVENSFLDKEEYKERQCKLNEGFRVYMENVRKRANKAISNRANKLSKYIYKEAEALSEIQATLQGYLNSDAMERKKAKYREIARLLKLLSIEIRNR